MTTAYVVDYQWMGDWYGCYHLRQIKNDIMYANNVFREIVLKSMTAHRIEIDTTWLFDATMMTFVICMVCALPLLCIYAMVQIISRFQANRINLPTLKKWRIRKWTGRNAPLKSGCIFTLLWKAIESAAEQISIKWPKEEKRRSRREMQSTNNDNNANN